MGMTIHYQLQSAADSHEIARDQITELRQRALDLPFAGVSELIELSGEECRDDAGDPDDPHRWLLIQSGQFIERQVCGETRSLNVPPAEIIAFEAMPGDGCEPANFGLCRYPTRLESGDGQDLDTGLTGWSWSSFCKTQYAGNPNCGGLRNFLRCHLTVIALLDCAAKLGILDGVTDEGGFWDDRDIEALARSVGEWNESIAGFVGQLNDEFGNAILAPVVEFPDFEHLESKGRFRDSE